MNCDDYLVKSNEQIASPIQTDNKPDLTFILSGLFVNHT